MPARELSRLVPDAPAALSEILDPQRGPLEYPNRSEIFGPERFAQHGRSLGEAHAARFAPAGSTAFFPRLRDNVRILREAHRYIGSQASTGYDVSPAAEWLLDNFHLVESQLREIREGLPRRYFRDLPVLRDEPLVGLPRIYGVAWAFVAHTDSAFDEELLVHFLKAYEETRELTLGELWALPTTLRVVLIENLRRLAERVAANKAARGVANLCCDQIESYSPDRLDALLSLLNRRGVGETFLAQMAQRLQDRQSVEEISAIEWLGRVAPHLADIQTRLPAAQAADNLSVGNAINSLRSISDADWPEIVAETSVLIGVMLRSPGFAAERDDTRDQTLHAIELLAKQSSFSEGKVAETLLALMQVARPAPDPDEPAGSASPQPARTAEKTPADDPARVASYWLDGPGEPALARALGLPDRHLRRRRWLWQRVALPAYLASICVATLGIVAWVLQRHVGVSPYGPDLPWLSIVAAVLMLFPASETAVAVINRLISESSSPRRLPRLAFANGIPPEHRPLVVIPAMLTTLRSGAELAHRLQLHYLANPEKGVQFALLTDWADAASERCHDDQALLDATIASIDRLNALYPVEAGEPARFIVLHRQRRFSESEQRWMGWERKRGKLEQLVEMLATGSPSSFLDLGAISRVGSGVHYVLTLDSDTRLPPGRLRDLVGVAAHPHNRPRLSADGRYVEHGYGILQPHVATPLPAPEDITLYHWLFSGQSGIDPYSIASSEVYQDLFGEGTFTGKGLLDVHALHAVLGKRLPSNQVLSHDLLEGALARCAAVTDVTVMEDAPFHADVAASRVHRWTRGDWQLLPILIRFRRYRIGAVNRWKMIDNMRRSLVPPASLALLALALGSDVTAPWAVLLLLAFAGTVGPAMGAVAALAPSRDDIAHTHFYRQSLADFGRTVFSGLWLMAQLLQLALMACDAIVRALWRTLVSRRHLLEWTTAAAAQASASTDLRVLIRLHWGVPLAALILGSALLVLQTPHPAMVVMLSVVWALSPLWTWWVSRPRPPLRADAISDTDRSLFEDVARDTWRLFERCVVIDEHDLPPDNLQTAPNDMVAHRTSPTNVGLYLLSTACARGFGWIGKLEAVERIEATLATLGRLARHRGHFLNWYDTVSTEPLLPLYVSTVDSGNLCVHLLAVAQACLEAAEALPSDPAPQRAIARSVARLAVLRAASDKAIEPGPLAALLACRDPLGEARAEPTRFGRMLDDATLALAAWAPPRLEFDAPGTPAHRLAWAIQDHIAMLRSVRRDLDAEADLPNRLRAAAAACRQLAGEADFEFLYSRKRRLFHIGFRILEHQLDAGFYDLLASEARATSLWAIAKGDVPAAHWAALGRPFFAVGALAGLRSWSGSMFEYLMPTLVLDEPHGSVLHDAGQAAVEEQIAFARERHVPWGISESAYAGSDHTLAYQYAPQGVPKLALRRSPAEELVVAPYATMLAAQVAPHRAAANLRRFEQAGARGRYGFIEALDYTPARQTGDEGVKRVYTYMAHHQGMAIVALANVLLQRAPRRWGMADARIEAVASLLHERAPREVPTLRDSPSIPVPQLQPRRGPGVLRDVLPGMAAIEPTHLLSNGHYAVSLRANGAGTSRWGAYGISRWRDDALRDSYGTFFHLRWDRQPRAVSLTQHPAPDRSAHYQSSFHADRVWFNAAWSEVEASTTVWVSPEDDIEFRRVVLRNLGDRVLDLELMSSFEVTLADARSDESHPAFQNLFITAQWQGPHQALVFERKARLGNDKPVLAAHFIAESEPAVGGARIQVDRQRWLGRNRDASRPLASFDEPPAADGKDEGEGASLDTGLDPVAALAVRVQIQPRGQVRVTFCTAAADNRTTLRAVIDKYRQPSNIERASMISATLAGIRMRDMGLGAETFAAMQILTTPLALTLTRVHARESDPGAVCDKRLLWRLGISGDRPILLVTAGVPQGHGLLRSLAQALRRWSWGGVACDLVVVNHEPASYVMTLRQQIMALKDGHVAALNAQPGAAETGFYVIAATDLQGDEMSTLRALARVRLNADGRPLSHHIQELAEAHDKALEDRQAVSSAALPAEMGADTVPRRPHGEFSQASGEFRFDVTALTRPARPWVNILANPDFGTQLSEAGGGYSWATNSRLNMLTPWSNDPVGDPPGESLLLQDMKTMQVWSITPSVSGDNQSEYRVAHGQGYSIVSHRHGALDVSATWCVDKDSAVKQVRLRLINRGHRSLQLRVIGVVEWILGANRSDRGSTHTQMASHAAAPGDAASGRNGDAEPPTPLRMTTLFCTQRDRAGGFGGGTAFFGLSGDADEGADWTCDRRESFDARGRFVVPDQYGRGSGCGLDPCAALSTPLQLRAGESFDRIFLLGWGPSPEAARTLAESAALQPALRRLQAARSHWDDLLGTTIVRTPDPLFDAMVNRWLLYQTIACRLWAKAGFYQAGGAYGYRDQLQDSLALAWSAPALLRKQILLSASRQFVEGDVQHWWHAPTGAGVRTHFSDDLLWLPYAALHYTQSTADATLLDEHVAFLEGIAVPAGAEDAYYAPAVTAETATVYEHCARTIDKSLPVGAHGLPLMGSGDWNDGMNRVGSEGRGESVWLAWFLCDIVARFAPLAEQRGEPARAARWREAMRGWQAALQSTAWDGEWYRRAFFDDGTALGTAADDECRIDLIAQAWAVLSRVAPEPFAAKAMAAIEAHLIDREAGLVKLLEPPLRHHEPNAGYIQAYPAGVRENGGQYSHAGVWALMAQAERGDGDAAYRYFTYLSPAHRSHDPAHGGAYAIEPYVMAGDVYSAPPYVGRGGWSWYTGSAGWMHRAAIESMFGMRQHGDEIEFVPCLPTAWKDAEIVLSRDGRKLRVLFARGAESAAEARALAFSAVPLHPGKRIRWSALAADACYLMVVPDAAAPTEEVLPEVSTPAR
ncbi:MAG: carbohydrate-binding protein [Pseudomonadota bacterium]|nr:carbohydrate-binding protein [Pseudomonadota bacterium]